MSAPLYGADMAGTFFKEGISPNINRIGCLLSDGIKDVQIKGVNSPYLYFGVWKSTIAWHKEDLDLAAVNYLHMGKTKFWYVIHP